MSTQRRPERTRGEGIGRRSEEEEEEEEEEYAPVAATASAPEAESEAEERSERQEKNSPKSSTASAAAQDRALAARPSSVQGRGKRSAARRTSAQTMIDESGALSLLLKPVLLLFAPPGRRVRTSATAADASDQRPR